MLFAIFNCAQIPPGPIAEAAEKKRNADFAALLTPYIQTNRKITGILYKK